MSAGLMASSLSLVAQTEVLHDWQFNDAADTIVFTDVVDDGTQAGSTSINWKDTTTDGAGNWHLTGMSENTYNGYWIHSSDEVIPADKHIVEWSFSDWDWSQHTGSSPHVGFGFVGEGGNGAALFLLQGTSVRVRDSVTNNIVANFLSNTYVNATIPEPKVPVDGNANPIEGAPALGAGDSLKFRYTVDFTGDNPVYSIEYTVNNGSWFLLHSGNWPHGQINRIRMQSPNPEPADSVKVDYIVMSSENPILPASGSIWEGVGTDYGNGIKFVGIGLINDSNWPWVWHYNSASWLYIDPASTLSNIYGAAMGDESSSWFWTSDDIGGYYYSVSEPDSGTMGWSLAW